MVAERGDRMAEYAQRLSGQSVEWNVERDVEVPEIPCRSRTLQSTVGRIPDVTVLENVPRYGVQRRTEDHTSEIPVPEAVEGLLEVSKTRVTEKVGKKIVQSQARSEDKAAGTPVVVRRQVFEIQKMSKKDVHENAGDDGLNVHGRGKSADVELFKQIRQRETELGLWGNQRWKPGKPEMIWSRVSTEFNRRRQSKYGAGSKERPDI